jgi:hypothetical protein
MNVAVIQTGLKVTFDDKTQQVMADQATFRSASGAEHLSTGFAQPDLLDRNGLQRRGFRDPMLFA